MSGLLRRIKRSRAANAGDAPEGQAAGLDDAPTTADTSAAASDAETSELPRGAGTSRPTVPPIKADPGIPAGLDPAEARTAPATGRRGRLRRRLRYLRRARELLLRDLGGLLYEVHRTGGGDVATHSAVIEAKVERLSDLDGEAAAIETALGAPRSDAVVFQPGIGGTCDSCGELYGSAARFCSHCGSPTGSAARAEPPPVPAMPKPAAAPTAGAAGAPAGAETEATHEGPATAEARSDVTEPPARDDPQADDTEPPVPRNPQTDDTEPPTPRNPQTDDTKAPSNGRPEERTQPDLSSGDPLATRESRS